jgi:Pilus formation protein N terminal region
MSHPKSFLAPRQRSIAALLAGLTLVTVGAATPAKAEDLIVKFDQSQLLRLPRPAAEIIIGNPAVADVAIQTGNLLVITGKSFGITNIIALDAERNVIQDQRVLVRRDEVSAVHVYRATARSTFNCVPQCNPSLMPGDDERHFQATQALSSAKIGFSDKAADAAAAAGNQQ